jgi:hypothetical protein
MPLVTLPFFSLITGLLPLPPTNGRGRDASPDVAAGFQHLEAVTRVLLLTRRQHDSVMLPFYCLIFFHRPLCRAATGTLRELAII